MRSRSRLERLNSVPLGRLLGRVLIFAAAALRFPLTLTRMQRNLDALSERVEFTRDELLFEIRSLLGRAGPRGTTSTPPTVMNARKVEEMTAAGALKLNVGCGHVPLESYVNVDFRALPGVDVVADAGDLPFPPGSVTELFCSHLLEHFPLEYLRRAVLPYWVDLLRPGARLRAIVPDAEAMIGAYARGQMPFEDLREVTYGLQEYEGDFHHNMFSRAMLQQLLESSGLADVQFPFVGRRNGKCFDMEVCGTKPRSPALAGHPAMTLDAAV